ncbi:MAG: hypothetical protein EZS28_007813 [Streblomastix strix]|uniref:Uncharacterized protein n=1 Tax=Streblomastix strix TaxID=222440 RepID=A0A5J4WNJ1_9EUKA|nr:MAG: hypothetical protein EZS28_007813 [Streblomastix strix]
MLLTFLDCSQKPLKESLGQISFILCRSCFKILEMKHLHLQFQEKIPKYLIPFLELDMSQVHLTWTIYTPTHITNRFTLNQLRFFNLQYLQIQR